ncbi:MAG: hypothetical protein M3R65_05390 [Gemmatimonadota bacterium]|nr:hypothetical protein [Gemmatimonadota bacterium]
MRVDPAAEAPNWLLSIPLAVIAEPARGGFHRYLGWTVARLPIPVDWPRARALLCEVAKDARAGRTLATVELDAIVLEAYGVPPDTYRPLLDWMCAADA